MWHELSGNLPHVRKDLTHAVHRVLSAATWNGAHVFGVLGKGISMFNNDAGKILDFILRSTAHSFGEAYFERLVRALSVALDCEHTFISLINDEATHLRTIARSYKGLPVYNFEYSLAGTGCEQAIRKGAHVIPHSLQALHGDCDLVAESKAESFIGLSLYDCDRQPLGVIGGLSSRPLSAESEKVALQILTLCAARVSSELCRNKTLEDLERLAYVDFLTKLPNRHAFENHLSEALSESLLDSELYSLIVVDLDRFKQLNDHCGHQVGDQALRQISAKMQSTLLEDDAIYRIGGDEFTVIVKRRPGKDSTDVAVGIMDAVDSFCFTHNGQEFKLGASMGVVNIDPALGDREKIFKLADSACYIAKEKGRGRIETAELNQDSIAAHIKCAEWPFRIKRALEENRFFLMGQPIRTLGSDDGINRIEMLARMVDDDGHHISPLDFIPAAERYGLMASIDKWVVVNALEWLEQNQTTNLRISINVSNMSVADESFRGCLLKTLRKHRHLASRVVFELTETCSFADTESVIVFMNQVKTLGAEFAMDDFGNGFSNYSMLGQLPLSVLKIDGSFIKDLMDDPVKQVMVASFTKVAHAMNLRVVAEFVQDLATAVWLKENGVDYAQGYYYSAPCELSTFETLHEKRNIA